MNIFQAGYFTEECGDPPSTVYYLPSNQSALYSLVTEEYEPLAYCGFNPKPQSNGIGCCTSSLDLSMTYGYHSISMNYVPNDNLEQYFPAKSINQQYCHVISYNSSKSGYYEAFFLSSGECFDKHYRCTPQEFQIYQNESCFGNTESFQIDGQVGNVTSAILGNLGLSLMTITEGQVTFTWTTYFPPSLLVPLNKCPMEIIQTTCITISIIGYIYVIFIRLIRYAKVRKPMNLFMPLAQLMLLTRIILATCTQYAQNWSQMQVLIVEFLIDIFLLGHLILGLTTCNIIVDIISPKKIYVIVLYTLVVLEHFAIFGLTYVYNILSFFDPASIWTFTPIQNLPTVHYLIEILWDSIPPGLLLYKITILIKDKKLPMNSRQKYSQFQKKLITLFGIQLLVFLSYLLLFVTSTWTLVFRTDRNQWSTFGISQFLLSIHALVIFHYFEELKSITQEVLVRKPTPIPKVRDDRTAANIFSEDYLNKD